MQILYLQKNNALPTFWKNLFEDKYKSLFIFSQNLRT